MTKKNRAVPVEIVPRDHKEDFKREVALFVEQQVSEALSHQSDRVFQPFFQTREIAHEIKRRQTVGEQNKFPNAFKKYGCLSCGRRDLPHQSLWMCTKCYPRRHQQILSVIREAEPPELPQPTFMDTVRMARASLVKPAVMAVAEPKALSSEGQSTRSALPRTKSPEQPGSSRVSAVPLAVQMLVPASGDKAFGNRFIWTQDDVQRLKEFATKRREARTAKPRPRKITRLGRPTRVLDQSAIAALRAQGKPWGEIAVILGCSPTTLYRMASQMKSEKSE